MIFYRDYNIYDASKSVAAGGADTKQKKSRRDEPRMGREKDGGVVCVLLAHHIDLSEIPRLAKGTAKEVLIFVSRQVARRTDRSFKNSISHKGFLCNVMVEEDGLCAAVMAEQGYPQRVSWNLCDDALEAFRDENGFEERWSKMKRDHNISVPKLRELLERYQDTANVDKVKNLQRKVEETTEVAQLAIEDLLARGENLDRMVSKSEELSANSKVFLKSTKKLKTCGWASMPCIVM